MTSEYKYMKKFLLGIGILFPVFALATTFPVSGINFDTSSISITGPAGANCLGEELPHTFSLSEMGFSTTTQSIPDFGDWSNPSDRCLQVAGTYSMTMNLLDNAGNIQSIPLESFVIKSATPDQNESEFSVTCNNPIANASDTCAVELRLRDQFKNDIEQELDDITLTASLIEDADDANEQTRFRAGLRMNGASLGSIPPFTWKMTDPFSASLSAIAPSIQRVETGIEGTYLATVVDRDINFTLSNISKINTNGTVLEEYFQFSDLPMTLRFGTPIEITPGFAAERIDFGDHVVINSVLDRPSGTIPSDIVTSTLKSVSEHLFLDPANNVPDENGILPPGTQLNESFTFEPVLDTETKPVVRIITALNAYDEVPENISLVTSAAYTLSGMPVLYPAGAIGQPIANAITDNGFFPEDIVGFNTTNIDLKNIGVSIEGIVIGDLDQMYLVGGDKNKMTTLSSLHTVDIREKIIKNAYQLIRNATNITTNANEFNWELFNDKDVVVVDLTEQDLPNATLTLNGGTFPAGQKTLIVVNGNVLFAGDYTYDNAATDSFGLILLRDTAGPEPERGNIFVHSNVQKLSGTLFADGGFFHGDTATRATANMGLRGKQLRLTGSLLARNTIGGSRRVGANFFSPWDTSDITTARRYDLHEVRKFDYDDTSIGNPDANCVKDDGVCDPNIAAFILRQDQKSTLLPPPAFLTD
jgi:hypothetical protein